LGVDAAILFADILLPLIPMGLELEFAKGEGPVIHNPYAQVRISPTCARRRGGRSGYVMEAIHTLRGELPVGVPLIGFAGAPSPWHPI